MKKITLLAVLMSLVFSAGVFAKNAYDLYNEAYDLYLVNDYKAAVRLFAEAIKKKPDFVKPYNKAGLAYVAMKKVDHALLMYKKAVYIDPKFAEAFYNAGVAYEIKYMDKNPGNVMAIEAYKKAIELNNDNYSFVRASLNLAGLYKGLQKYDDAIELLRKAMKVEPDFAELYNASGLIYMANGNNEAESSRDKMSQASGKAKVFKTSYDYAVKFFEKALQIQQRYPEASTNMGIAFLKQGKLARAIKQFEDTLATDPNFAGAHYNYANALIINGFYDKAISHLQKAAALDPEMVEAYYSLGKAYEHLNRFNEAEKAYKAALEKKKDYVIAKNAYDTLRKKREDFRSHITFKKKVAEGEEGGDEGEQAVDESEMTKEQLAAAKKAKAEAEDVEDLRLPEDKPTPAEGEEAAE
jgi:tetratricopeptide (TPR) repeat protein